MRIKSTQRSIRTRVNEDTLSNRVEKLHYPRCLVIVKKKKKDQDNRLCLADLLIRSFCSRRAL